MSTWIGTFNQSDYPVVKINIYGIFQGLQQEFDARIDTGFTGFLSMPLTLAFPLGLMLSGTTTLVFADGSSQATFTAWGHVSRDNEDHTGVIVLQESAGEVLIGMEFLRRFGEGLYVSQKKKSGVLVGDGPPGRPQTASRDAAGGAAAGQFSAARGGEPPPSRRLRENVIPPTRRG